MPLPTKFSTSEKEMATTAWVSRCAQWHGKYEKQIRDERSIETYAGIECTMERNWFRDQLKEARKENALLLQRIHRNEDCT